VIETFSKKQIAQVDHRKGDTVQPEKVDVLPLKAD
jgi:hypothetical protein